MVSSVPLSLPPRRESRSPYIARFARYYQERLLHGRCFRNLRETNKPLALASRPTSIGPDRRRTLAYGSAYAPATRTVKMQLAPPEVSSSSVDEVQPTSCCWCRCRPAGVTAETTAVDRNRRVETTAVHQPLLQAYQSAGGTSCGPLVCICYTRVRSFQSVGVMVVLSLPSALDVFPSVEPTTIVNICIQFAGRTHHYRKHMYSIRRFRFLTSVAYCTQGLHAVFLRVGIM